MREGRLFQLLYLLIERGGMTAVALAEKLEVSVRTLLGRSKGRREMRLPLYYFCLCFSNTDTNGRAISAQSTPARSYLPR